MCLGAGARAANDKADADYQYQLQRREADWNQQLALTFTEQAEYDIGLDRSRVYTQDAYASLQNQLNDAFSQVMQKDEKNWKDFVSNSQGSKLAATGQTGRSVTRQKILDFGDYQREVGRNNYLMTKSKRKIKEESEAVRQKQMLNEESLFSKVQFIKQPDLEPPKPVYQNETMAMFTDALSIGSSIMGFF